MPAGGSVPVVVTVPRLEIEMTVSRVEVTVLHRSRQVSTPLGTVPEDQQIFRQFTDQITALARACPPYSWSWEPATENT